MWMRKPGSRRGMPSPRTWRRSKAARPRLRPVPPAGWSALAVKDAVLLRREQERVLTCPRTLRATLLLSPQKSSRPLNIDRGRQRIVLDEFAPRFDHIAHQLGEQFARLVGMLDFDHQQRAGVLVQGGFPQLLRVH